MIDLTRRNFIAAAGACTLAGRLSAKPLGLPIGSQTYPHRQRIKDNDFPGLLNDMKALGIESVELCCPAYAEFSSLSDGKQTRTIIEDHGLKSVSAHFTMNSLRNQQPQMIEWAKQIGMTQMATASLGGKVENGMVSMDAVKRAADE